MASIFGSIDITQRKECLEELWQLKGILDNIAVVEPEAVRNPFMNNKEDVAIEYERQDDTVEEGVIVPHDRISPDTLRKMVEEFVTRDWSELTDAGRTLDDKIEQVIQQLKDGRAKVVFDLTTETCNIIPVDRVKDTREPV